ncbi:hypothetical protein AHAS_Ahas19G0098300 [Arachis hypogaea]
MNQMRLRGRVVFVGEAKYRRAPESDNMNKRNEGDETENPRILQIRQEVVQNELVVGNEKRTEGLEKDSHEDRRVKNVDLAVVTENMEWLQRSLVVVFGAEEAYMFNMNSLLQLFHSVRRWEASKHSDKQRVWLECFGVPLHIWSVETFKTIGGLWGDVIACDQRTELCSSFTVGRVQIDTCVKDIIQEWIHITVGTEGFDILIKKIGHETCNLIDSENSEARDETLHLDHGSTSKKSGLDIWPSQKAESWNGVFHDEELGMMGPQGEDDDKGKIVIADEILNEWINEDGYRNYGEIITYHADRGKNHGAPNYDGTNAQSSEADSERTVTSILHGLPKRPTIEKTHNQKKGAGTGYTNLQGDGRIGCPTKNCGERLDQLGLMPLARVEIPAGPELDESGHCGDWSGAVGVLEPNRAKGEGSSRDGDACEVDGGAREGSGPRDAADDEGSPGTGEEELLAVRAERETIGVAEDQNVCAGGNDEGDERGEEVETTALDGYDPEDHGKLKQKGAVLELSSGDDQGSANRGRMAMGLRTGQGWPWY